MGICVIWAHFESLLPISDRFINATSCKKNSTAVVIGVPIIRLQSYCLGVMHHRVIRSEEHTSELQSHSDLHSFPTRRSSDLINATSCKKNSTAVVIGVPIIRLQSYCLGVMHHRVI